MSSRRFEGQHFVELGLPLILKSVHYKGIRKYVSKQ
jgi:hypothetical protein